MSNQPAGSFYLCFFSPEGRRLWSLHVSGICHHMDIHPSMNVYPTSWFILSVLFLIANQMSLVPIHVQDPPSHRPPPQQECLPDQLVHSVCLALTGSETSVVPTYVQDPHHTDLHPGRNVYSTSHFNLSLLFLTGGETSVVPTHVRDPPSHRPPLQ